MSERAQTWRNAIISGVFFGVIFGLVMSLWNGQLPPSSAGDVAAIVLIIVISGFAFGLLTGLFARSRFLPQAKDIALASGEEIEYSGLANHFLNMEARGGRLAVTKTHLVFKPHVVNLQTSELSIPRSDIVSVAATRTLGIIPNGLAVTLKDGKVERFVVNNRKQWIAHLAPAR